MSTSWNNFQCSDIFTAEYSSVLYSVPGRLSGSIVVYCTFNMYCNFPLLLCVTCDVWLWSTVQYSTVQISKYFTVSSGQLLPAADAVSSGSECGSVSCERTKLKRQSQKVWFWGYFVKNQLKTCFLSLLSAVKL